MQSHCFPNSLRILLAGLMILLVSWQSATAIKHTFIAIDEGLGNLLYVNEYDSTANWIVRVNRKVNSDSVYAPRDMQLVGNNRILIGHTKGFTEYDITTGAIKRDVLLYDSVSSVRRLPGGQTLIVGVDLDGSKGVVMIKLDSLNVKIKKTVFPGTYVRLVRQTKTGTFLFACNDTIKEGDTTGTFIWKAYLLGTPASNKHMWKVVRLDNGNVFLSAGYGAFLAEVNPQGAIVRTIGAAPQPAGVNPFFYGMFQILTNGDYVVANWQNHGAGHGNAGIELLEFNSTGTIVWQWNKSSIISSLQGVLILDSLNTSLLYDDRNGVMTPLNSGVQVINPSYNNPTNLGKKSVNFKSSSEIYTISGRRINPDLKNNGMTIHRPQEIFIEHEPNNSYKKRIGTEIN